MAEPANILIRPARRSDQAALVDLKQDMTRREHAQVDPASPLAALYNLSREAAEEGVSNYWRWVADPGGEYFVAELDGAVVGSALWFRHRGGSAFNETDRNIGIVAGVVVRPEARGRGIAERLMAHVEDRMRAAGVAHAMLEVTAGNVAARALYEKRGFWPLDIAMMKPLR